MDACHSQDEVRSTDGWARRICRSVSDAAAAAAAAAAVPAIGVMCHRFAK